MCDKPTNEGSWIKITPKYFLPHEKEQLFLDMRKIKLNVFCFRSFDILTGGVLAAGTKTN